MCSANIARPPLLVRARFKGQMGMPDEAFGKMGKTREKLYGTIEGGGYHVKIKTPGESHNCFVDIRLLGCPDGAGINAWQQGIRTVPPNGHILKTTNSWTRAFFDKTVRGIPGPLGELMRTRSSEVEIRHYAPIAR